MAVGEGVGRVWLGMPFRVSISQWKGKDKRGVEKAGQAHACALLRFPCDPQPPALSLTPLLKSSIVIVDRLMSSATMLFTHTNHPPSN